MASLVVFEAVPRDARLKDEEIFDPATRQFAMDFRRGEPQFGDAKIGKQWLNIRRRVADHLLQLVVETPWSSSLVLRGSTLMKTW